MVDVTDSKSVGGDTVWVRVPPPAPEKGHPKGCPFSGAAPSARRDPLRSNYWEGITNPLPSPPHANLKFGSDSDCPGAPRQKNSAPFRFRGLRKSRENCTSAEPFFLYQIEPASLGFDLDTGSDLDSSGAPKRRESEQDSLLFGGPPPAGNDPFSSNTARGNNRASSPDRNLDFAGVGRDRAAAAARHIRHLNLSGIGFRVEDLFCQQ